MDSVYRRFLCDMIYLNSGQAVTRSSIWVLLIKGRLYTLPSATSQDRIHSHVLLLPVLLFDLRSTLCYQLTIVTYMLVPLCNRAGQVDRTARDIRSLK